MLSRVSFLVASSSSRRACLVGASRRILSPTTTVAPFQTMRIHSAVAMNHGHNVEAPQDDDSPSRVQHALLEALISCSHEPLSSSRRDSVYQQLKELPIEICPEKLEYDHRKALLIPELAFQPDDPTFASLLDHVLGKRQELDPESFWKTFAFFYKCPQVVRCGNDDQDNVLWPRTSW